MGNPVTLVTEADRLHVIEVPVEVPAMGHDPLLDRGLGDPLGDAVDPLEGGELVVLVDQAGAPAGLAQRAYDATMMNTRRMSMTNDT